MSWQDGKAVLLLRRCSTCYDYLFGEVELVREKVEGGLSVFFAVWTGVRLVFVRGGKIENEGEKEGKIGGRADCCVLGVGKRYAGVKSKLGFVGTDVM